MELRWYDIREMSDAQYNEAFSMLCSARKTEVKQLAQDDDRRRTVTGEMLARQALSEIMNVSPTEITLTRDEKGKPVVANCPVYFSVSHSGPYVVCAINDKPIGVDIEVIRSSQAKFIQRVCSEAELRYIRLGDVGDLQRFWEIWTAKEALFKLTGIGPLLKLSCFELPENIALDYICKNGCAVTTAIHLD